MNGTWVPYVGCTIASLVNHFNVGGVNGLPVIDKTGLTGLYGMWIVILPDADCVGGGCRYSEPFESAVKRELGLDLVKTTAPYRVLHVTKIEPPRYN